MSSVGPLTDNTPKIIEALGQIGVKHEQISLSGNFEDNVTYTPLNVPSIKITPQPTTDSSQNRYQQVLAIVDLAKKMRFSLHIVSAGLNLGYGGFEPYESSVILDLSQFKLISHYDPDTGQIKVEPGVTQTDISHYLGKNGDTHIHDTTGAPPQASIIGNYLERGFGHTPLAEHAKNILNAEIIVPHGEEQPAHSYITSTNGTAVEILGENTVRSYCIGPDLSGIIVQNNIAIVVNMTIKLLAKPACFVPFFIPFKQAQVQTVIDMCAGLKSQGTLHSAAHIGNNMKTLQLLAVECPTIITSYENDELSQLMASLGLDDWTLSGAFYGTRHQVRAHQKDLNSAIKKLGLRAIYLSPFKLTLVKRLAKFVERFKSKLEKALLSSTSVHRKIAAKVLMLPGLVELCNIKQGVPTDHFVKSIYWRNLHKLKPQALKPAKDNVGLLWGAPCAKISGAYFNSITELMTNLCQKYNLEAPISVTLLNDSTMECVLSISFDRDNPEEEKRAVECYTELMKTYASMNFVQYRMSTLSNAFLTTKDVSLPLEILDLKNSLDPLNIISPNKYKLLSKNFTQPSTPI